MEFYIVLHIALGFLAANSAEIQILSRDPGACPSWVYGSWGQLGAAMMSLVAFAAIITTLFQWGLTYAVYTFGELLIGAVIVKVIPLTVRFALALTGPLIALAIIGTLWGI